MKELVEKITARIAARGAIPFSDFMELALYCPDYGYYEREEDKIGRQGDFFTSPSVGPLFGQLIALWLTDHAASCLPGAEASPMDRPEPLQIVEAGAHRGDLARDILAWLRDNSPRLHETVRYTIIEPSNRRREWQKATLAVFLPAVRWLGGIEELEPITGVILSNELLDAFPIRRFRWNASAETWSEAAVTLDAGSFAWAWINPKDPLPKPLDQVAAPLEDGFTIDIAPAAAEWWRAAADRLARGSLLTFDYGLTTPELFLPHRREGTLRAYRRHRLCTDLLASPGEQDLTAHVDFSALQTAGESAGLRTAFFGTQSSFLTSIASPLLQSPQGPGWTPQQIRQFHTLTHPEHLGHKFRVLLQTRLPTVS